MSLNKTLDRLFNAIRQEAKRNPDFADRIDAILRAHSSQREVDAAAIAAVEAEADPPPAKASAKAGAKPVEAKPAVKAPDINPVGVLQKGGEDALEEVLISHGREALLALIAEHNLDPGGEAARLDRDALQAHLVAAAKRRVERDKKLFEY